MKKVRKNTLIKINKAGNKNKDKKLKKDLIVCCHCFGCKKSLKRIFSEQAWAVLLLCKEIEPETIDQPICDTCYEELRVILIERAQDVEEGAKSIKVNSNLLKTNKTLSGS
jgi:hypothetical protein